MELAQLIKDLVSRQGRQVHESASVHASAVIKNSFIGPGVSVYEGATVRDSVIMNGVTIGHGSEIARSLILEQSMIPRFNYVGSSLLGRSVQLGGAVMFASHRHDWEPPVLNWGEHHLQMPTERFGAIVGDDVTIAYGCHVNPGTVVGRDSLVLPLVDLHGYVPPQSIVRVKQSVQVMHRRIIPKPHGIPLNEF